MEIANRGLDQFKCILFHADQFEMTDPAVTKAAAHAPLFDRDCMFAWAGWQSDLEDNEFGLITPNAAVNSTVRVFD